MLVGIPPFYDRNQGKMFQKIRDDQVRFIPQIKISENGQNLIKQLLEKDPEQRIGVNGDSEIKNHPWFKKIDWDLLLQKKVETPFKPQINGENWINNFDSEFT